jgi:hypothetical protein
MRRSEELRTAVATEPPTVAGHPAPMSSRYPRTLILHWEGSGTSPARVASLSGARAPTGVATLPSGTARAAGAGGPFLQQSP